MHKIDIDYIKSIYSGKKPDSIDPIKKATVLIAIIDIDGVLHMIFEKRSNTVGQPSDISFIGGHIDKNETPLQAIMREAYEECNLKKENIAILGQNDYLINYAKLKIYPFVAHIKNIQFDDIITNDEVEKLIAIPLDTILNTTYKEYTSKLQASRPSDFPYNLIENGKNYKFFSTYEKFFFYEFKEVVIWGLTAKILKSFVDFVQNNNNYKKI